MTTIKITVVQLRDIIKRKVLFTLAGKGFNISGFSIVRHMKDSTDDSEIWKDYWEERHPSHHFPSEPHKCPSCLLKKDDFIGGHVICEGQTYIIPVCKGCNSEFKGDKADKHPFYVKTEDMVRVLED